MRFANKTSHPFLYACLIFVREPKVGSERSSGCVLALCQRKDALLSFLFGSSFAMKGRPDSGGSNAANATQPPLVAD